MNILQINSSARRLHEGQGSVSTLLANEVVAQLVARNAGATFKYGANGPEGLVTGKQVIVVSTRGGVYRGQPADNIVPYLQLTLGFLGMTDVKFVLAEGLNMGEEAAAKGLATAREEIAALFGETQTA